MNTLLLQRNERVAGFTLIELLVVIAIIGILSAIGITTYNGALQRARDSQRRSHIEELQMALESYFLAEGSYPTTSGNLASNCDGWDGFGHLWLGTVLEPLVTEGHLQEIPLDPRGDWPFCYYYQEPASYVQCPDASSSNYILFFGTEATQYSDLTEYNIVGENGSERRYCIYSSI